MFKLNENTGDVAPLLVVDVRQAARMLAVSSGSIRNLISRGVLRPVRIGRRVLIAVAELKRFAEGRMEEDAS